MSLPQRCSSPDKHQIKARAAGHWDMILSRLMPQLAPAIEAGHKKKVACPFHAGETESNFRILRDFPETGGVVCNTCGVKPDGFATLAWSGMTFNEAVCAVADILDGTYQGWTQEQLARQQATLEAQRVQAEKKKIADDKRYRRRLNQVWKESVPMDHASALPGRLYLLKRGLGKLEDYPSELRFHKGLAYTDSNGRYMGQWPAIVARIRSADGKPASLLRIYVGPEGEKTSLPERKKMMSMPSDTSITGGAIRLMRPGKTLGIAEGVETALAAYLLTGIPCWSAFSAQLLEGFIPPAGVENVIVFADKDRNGRGEQAAKVLVEKLWKSGIRAGIKLPPGEIPANDKGIDWLDHILNTTNQ